MEIKKSPKADLENKKLTYHLIGYVVVLAALFFAFEWSNTEVSRQEISDAGLAVVAEEEMTITTMTEPAPPPPPAPPTIEDMIEIVEDDKIIDEVEIQSVEDDQKKAQTFDTGPKRYGNGTGPAVDEAPVEDEIFEVVEDNPEFPGGMGALATFLSKEIMYPTIAAENNIQGRVICSFVVNKDGSIVDVKIVRSIDPSLDKEAIRVINKMPKWKPGKQRGKPVRTRFTLPVNFRLRS